MERVTFVIERTGGRVSCLLNPEALDARRTAGVVRRGGAGGAVLGNPRTDDPLVATGGGVTEYDLRLLFDVDVANEGRAVRQPSAQPAAPPLTGVAGVEPAGPPGGAPPGADAASPAAFAPVAPPSPDLLPALEPELPLVVDVRSLTQPIWALAETGTAADGAVAPPRVRFIWGKSWNVPGVVLAVAERLERFDGAGVPRRSWLSLRLRRVEERAVASGPAREPTTPQYESEPPAGGTGAADEEVVTVPVDPDGLLQVHYHQLCHLHFGDPALGPALAEYNDRDELLFGEEGALVRIPRCGALPVRP